MGVRYIVSGILQDLCEDSDKFSLGKDFDDGNYETEYYEIKAKKGNGAVVDYLWLRGRITSEGDDHCSGETKLLEKIRSGEKRTIGSIEFEGY